MQNFEGLGHFYLGARRGPESSERDDQPLLYPSKHLVTHAVVVGMTGSGKTGLCSVLLEEAALDGVPAILIDPKGDLANLLLTFPQLQPSDFEPWIDPDEARVKGVSVARLAEQTAERWRDGLSQWGQDGARIQRLRDAAEFTVYTPGSSAGVPVSIVESFAAPAAETLDDLEALTERVATLVSSLLGLAGIEADPVQSREHILLSAIVHHAWAAGEDLDLGRLIAHVQRPPMERVGVLELEAFYPAKERQRLALALNNLLASPAFAAWTQGAPLELDSLLYTPAGKPRIAIFSIAHLSDAQRMFFVALLLNQTLAWVRRQRGTSSLRALVYMDEIAGYFPPVANPPSKAPLLTLMKQARAFGVGVVLATQNPVDLDYKGLSNAGTWFVGRLQTERDKARLLDGLEGAASQSGVGFDRASMERVLSSLGARMFLMNDVHENAPQVIETRWALSYLRGPMTRAELKLLQQGGPSSARRTSTAGDASVAPAVQPSQPSQPSQPVAQPVSPPPATTPLGAPSTPARAADAAPLLPTEIQQYFLPLRRAASRVEYRPALLGSAHVGFTQSKLALDVQREQVWLCGARPGPVAFEWDPSAALDLDLSELEGSPVAGASFAPLPPACTQPKSYASWGKALVDALYRNVRLELWESGRTGLVSRPDESERDFRLRVAQHAREERDAALDKLRAKHEPKLATLEERRRKRMQALEVQAEQSSDAKVSSALSFGSALLSALMGRKLASSSNVGRATTAARGVSRSLKESSDVERARADLNSAEEELRRMREQLERDLAALAAQFDPSGETLTRRTLEPKKSAIQLRAVVLAWAPHDATTGVALWS